MADDEPEQRPRSRWRWTTRRVAVAAVVMGGLGLASVAVIYRWQSGSLRRQAVAAQRAAEAGRHEEAFRIFAAAAHQQPERMDLARAGAIEALRAGRLPEAAQLARQAWAAGGRDEVVLETLIATDPALAEDEAGLARAEVLLSEVADPAARLRLRTRLLVRRDRWVDAVPVLRQLLALDDSIAVRTALAEAHLRLAQDAEAVAILAPVRSELDGRGVRLLAFAQLRTADVTTMASTWANVAELFTALDAGGIVDGDVLRDAALYAVIRFDLAAAEAYLARIITGQHQFEARLLGWWLARMRGDATASPTLDGLGGAEMEGLRLLIEVAARNDPEQMTFAVQKVSRLVGAKPALELFAGSWFMGAARPREAIGHFSAITGLLAQAPMVRIAHAQALAAAGDQQAAIALLADLHARIGVTKRSLLLLAELTGKEWSAAEHHQVQRLLAEQVRDTDLVGLATRLAQRQLAAWLGTADIEGAPEDQGARRQAITAVGDALRHGDERVFAAIDALSLAAGPQALLRGMALQTKGRHQEALTAFAEARQAGAPTGIATAEALSAAALQDRASVIAALQRAVVDDPSDVIAWHLRADLVTDPGEGDALLTELDRAPLRPVDADAIRAVIHVRRGDVVAAHVAADAVIAAEADHPIALPMAVDLRLAAGHWQEALDLLPVVHVRGRDDLRLRRLSAHLALGQAAAALQDLDACMPATQRILEADGVRVALCLATGDFAAAGRAVDRLPAHTSAIRRAVWMARVQEASGRAAAAVVTLDPHLADVDAAGTWLSLVLRHDIGGDPATRLLALDLPPLVLRRLAAVAGQLGRFPVAAALAQAAHAAASEDAGTRNDWAWWGSRAGWLDRAAAIAVAEQALATMPGHPDILDTVTRLLIEADRAPDALALLAANAASVAASDELQVALAQALLAVGDRAGAAAIAEAILARAAKQAQWPLRTKRSVVEDLRKAEEP